MGEGDFIAQPQFLSSSCQVILDTTTKNRSVVLSCCGLTLDTTIDPDTSANIKTIIAVDLSIDMTEYTLSNTSYSFDTDSSEFVELETNYEPSPRFGHGTIKLDDDALIICGALDKTVLDFSNIPIFENKITSETYINLTEYLDFISDATLSTGSFGMEEILTDKTAD